MSNNENPQAEKFCAAISDLIKETRKTYTDSPKRFISDYNNELGLTKEYNGRQILELLQNADDAGSESVLVTFDKAAKRLIIANKGSSFTVQGIESLMLANLSPKTGRIYIGNKGLGFRSILNWANKVLIRTNGCIVEFSPLIAKEEFSDLKINADTKRKLLEGRGLSNNAIPFPILAIPRVDLDKTPDPQWTTLIEIHYKEEFDESIQLQLEDCREEILLFLNKIETIEIDGLPEGKMQFHKEVKPHPNLKLIAIKDKIWRVKSKEDFLPEHLQDKSKSEKESYNITIAFQENLTDNYYKLFNYFPTKLSIYLPCIIHATFELNSSRDYLNDSLKNEFIFAKMVELLRECSLELTSENTDWRPFKLILPSKKETDSKLIDAFYTKLSKLYEELEIFPCVNESYEKFSTIKYYGNDFSDWIKKQKFGTHFPQLLTSVEKSISDSFKISFRNYPDENFVTIIENTTRQEMPLEARAELISIFLGEGFKLNLSERYSLLVNDSDVVIDRSNVAFTPQIESGEAFKRPDFIDIDFINKTLYHQLVNLHKGRFNPNEPEAREFQRLFKVILNIQPYDSNAVISRIISGTKDKIKSSTEEEGISAIKQMVKCLFENYQSLKYKVEVFSDSCPLFNKTFKIVDSHSLFLNSSFPSGKTTEFLYEEILTPDDYVSDISNYGIDHADVSVSEAFFIWLGVNKYVQINTLELKMENWESKPYFDFVFYKVTKPHPASRFSFSGKEIGLFEKTVAKLSNEKLIYLLLKEERLSHRLDFTNEDRLTYQYVNSYTDLQVKPSYIFYQLRTLNRFDDYLIENNEISFINAFQINYDAPIFKQSGIKDSQVIEILEKLGAQRSFVDLTTNKVFELLHKCGQINADEKEARKLYLNSFDHYRDPRHDAKQTVLPGTKLFAISEGFKGYRPFNEVYYYDNNTLPEKIARKLWVLDFPKRAGELQVSKLFGVKTFKELKLKIDESNLPQHDENIDFNLWFNRIKPLILCYRISGLKKLDDKREAAKILRRSQINLVSQACYTINDGEAQTLDFEEFLVSKDGYLIRAQPGKKLENFKSSSKFCGAFAEIMCILFKVNESKNSYISVFKDSIEFSKDVVKADSLDESLALAYELLGLSQNESSVWEAICKIKDIPWPEYISDESQLRRYMKEKGQYDLPDWYQQIDFDDFSNSVSIEFFQDIENKLGITLKKIKDFYPEFSGLRKWHLNQITDSSRDVESIFAYTRWKKLSETAPSEQRHFLKERNAFRIWFENYNWSESELPSYEFNPDYKSILISKAQKEFNIEFIDAVEPIQFHSDYKEILGEHDEIEKSLSEEQRSLLYFGGNQEEILQAIEALLKKVNTSHGEDEPGKMVLPIIETSVGSIINVESTADKRQNGNKGGPYDPTKDKNKRKAGKIAEQKVRDTLVDNYGRDNVKWVSGNSDEDEVDDNLGYDFRYRKIKSEEWSFLEVKSVSHKSFIISQPELSFAFRNKDKYHIAFVKSEQIVIDSRFFQNLELENEFNRINSGLSIKPCDFEIFIDLEKAKAEGITGAEHKLDTQRVLAD